ncbi:MAG TPA: S53 family peptidase [Ktedonobacteraceae bacterium]
MRRNIRRNMSGLSILLVLLLASWWIIPGHFFNSASASTDQALKPLSVGGVPALLSKSQQQGADQSTRILHMSVGLAPRNQSQLATLLKALYTPSSPEYHQFLSVADYTLQFGPSATEQQTVVDYLTQQGFTITQTYPNHLLVDFSGTETLAERVFSVTIKQFKAPDGRLFFANTAAPKLPTFLATSISSLSGLDNANQFYHPPVVSHNKPRLSPKASANCPSASSSALIPSQLATAYNYNGLHSVGLQGEGQTVGVFELDGYSQSDVQTYAQCFGGSGVPLQNVAVDGFNGQPGAGAVEVELDIELLLSQAPHLAKVLVYEAPNTTQGYNDEFARIVSDRTPVVSVSWGDCEKNMGQQELQQENTFFQEAAAQGQSILVAAGDSGSASCFQLLQGGSTDFSLNADDPASQPFVTGVGGTHLTLNSGNGYQTEAVWNGGLLGGAGGGGLSQFWKMPAWQSGPGVKNSYSNGMRELPDVSLDADPATGYPIYCTAGSSCSGSGGIGGIGSSSGWLTVGGTSAAAPMWAAMVVLANELAAKAGKGPLGFLNPAIYKLASQSSSYSRDFHDITQTGNNDEIGINGGAYPVTTAYDQATGWGSLNAAKLVSDMVALAK